MLIAMLHAGYLTRVHSLVTHSGVARPATASSWSLGLAAPRVLIEPYSLEPVHPDPYLATLANPPPTASQPPPVFSKSGPRPRIYRKQSSSVLTRGDRTPPDISQRRKGLAALAWGPPP